jgi:hypothetical protein
MAQRADPIEQRLFAAARPELAATLGDNSLAAGLAEGGSMREDKMYALLGEKLASLPTSPRSR